MMPLADGRACRSYGTESARYSSTTRERNSRNAVAYSSTKSARFTRQPRNAFNLSPCNATQISSLSEAHLTERRVGASSDFLRARAARTSQPHQPHFSAALSAEIQPTSGTLGSPYARQQLAGRFRRSGTRSGYLESVALGADAPASLSPAQIRAELKALKASHEAFRASLREASRRFDPNNTTTSLRLTDLARRDSSDHSPFARGGMPSLRRPVLDRLRRLGPIRAADLVENSNFGAAAAASADSSVSSPILPPPSQISSPTTASMGSNSSTWSPPPTSSSSHTLRVVVRRGGYEQAAMDPLAGFLTSLTTDHNESPHHRSEAEEPRRRETAGFVRRVEDPSLEMAMAMLSHVVSTFHNNITNDANGGLSSTGSSFFVQNAERGFTDAEIELFPVGAYKPQPNDEDSACLICLGEYEMEEKIKFLPCSHRFHPDCIDNWLRRSCFCPLCKYEISFD